MKIRTNNKIVASAIIGVISLGTVFGGYSLLHKDVTLMVKGNEKNISTLKSSVQDLLKSENISYDANDIISKPLDAKLVDGMKIEIIDVSEKTIKEYKEIPFETEVEEDNNIDKGKMLVSQEGQDGKSELSYKLVYHNGKQVSKDLVNEATAIEPTKKILKKGSKVDVLVASSRGETTRIVNTSVLPGQATVNGKKMSVVATAYTGDSITSTGTTPKWGTIAVDPSVIPYGTKVYIPQFNKTFIAEDTGSAIKGNKIDIFMNDENTVYNWGVKNIDIEIVG